MTEEYVDHVDENDKVIDKVTRKESNEKKLRRRVSRVFIFNNKNEILVHKRASTKLEYPAHWDFGVAEAAIRGLKEELNINGISKSDMKILFKLKYEDKAAKRWYKVYSLIYNGPIKADEEEISEAGFVSETHLNEILEKEKFIPAGLKVYQEYKKLKNNK